MCMNFADLNKCGPKDDFPLPRINTSLDKVEDCEMFSLLECFFSYHPIWMNKEENGKTSFITPMG